MLAACDDLLEGSVPAEFQMPPLASRGLERPESFSRPPPHGTSDCADLGGLPGTPQDQSAARRGRAVLRLLPWTRSRSRTRTARPFPSSPAHDLLVLPPRSRPRVHPRVRPGPGTHPLGDVLADSGYSHRIPRHWASPLRAAGAQLVQDLHPHDRGPKGTHRGRHRRQREPLLPGHAPLPAGTRPARTATPEQAAGHDRKTAEAARCKLGRITRDDEDGYHRVQCPAAAGKVRCPLRPPSMTLDRDRPEILAPPEHPQACCTQQTITVPPEVNAKTAQKHDYPSAAWRRSYARRTGAERGFATAKDPAASDISCGWCRLMGLAPLMLFTVTLLVVRNQRILRAWNARQEENRRRAAKGLPPKTRKRRRKTLASLAPPP